MKFLKSIIFGAIIILSFSLFAKEKASPKVHGVIIPAGEHIGLQIHNLIPVLVQQDTEANFACTNGLVFALKFETKPDLFISCGQAYGGVLRIHSNRTEKPGEGLVIAEDWGDEGCIKKTSSVLSFSKSGAIKLAKTTVRSGNLVGGTKSDCDPGKEQSDFIFDSKSKEFKPQPLN